jgi:gamma-tubulin complex component 5
MISKSSPYLQPLLLIISPASRKYRVVVFFSLMYEKTSCTDMSSHFCQTSSLHRAIVSVLDICLHFSDFFVAFAGDTTTHDISRQSITVRRHRSRRQRQQRKNIIAFSQSLQNTEHTSGEDSDLDEKHNADLDNTAEPSHSTGASMSHSEGGFVNHIDKMAAELDGLVRFIRRGTESLAGGTGEAAPAFEVLAFALEDWDS